MRPKSTNFGLGISIFQQGVTDRDDFAKAVEIAFREDKEIMVEDYLLGTEYRFFVLGDQTLAVFYVFQQMSWRWCTYRLLNWLRLKMIILYGRW